MNAQRTDRPTKCQPRLYERLLTMMLYTYAKPTSSDRACSSDMRESVVYSDIAVLVGLVRVAVCARTEARVSLTSGGHR